ncbi:MAG: hypothetical protein IH840_18365 [Candidatus Heimdallarchaeota archaeon]|nr:hypothetical protein [Candidatus Heimdallarchaeota archaeon]
MRRSLRDNTGLPPAYNSQHGSTGGSKTLLRVTVLFYSKCLSIIHISFIFYLVNSFVSFFILLTIYPLFRVIAIFVPSILIFYLIIIFYTFSIVFMIFIVKSVSLDPIGPLFFPVLVYFVIPLLINSSLSLEVFNPIFLKFSPTIWVIDFVANTIFIFKMTFSVVLIPFSIIILGKISKKLFSKIEYN